MKSLAIISSAATVMLAGFCIPAGAQPSISQPANPSNAAAALVKAAQASPAKASASASATSPASSASTALAAQATPAASVTQKQVAPAKRPAAHSAPVKPKQPAVPMIETAAPPQIAPTRSGLPFSPNSINDRGIKAFAMPLDSKLVVFPYDPNYTYPLYCRVGMFTRIKLEPGERVIGFYLSDQVRWIQHVAKDRTTVLVMPMAESPNSASLRTTKREYELFFTTVPEPENWYQRVSWHIPLSNFEEEIDGADSKAPLDEVDSFSEAKTSRSDRQTSANTADRTTPAGDDPDMVNLDKVNFNYTIEGDASFKPSMVFDDGRSTWFKMPKSQDAPVFFALFKDGEGIPVTPVPRGQFVIVGQVMPYGALLKIGKDEVRIKNKSTDCGFFVRGCWSGAGARNIRD